jgi:hypothetical protein
MLGKISCLVDGTPRAKPKWSSPKRSERNFMPVVEPADFELRRDSPTSLVHGADGADRRMSLRRLREVSLLGSMGALRL